jgi:hypothetical protein
MSDAGDGRPHARRRGLSSAHAQVRAR